MKEASGKLLNKSERAIHAAEVLLREGDLDFAAGRAYYAMFYAAEALLHERGVRFSKHSAVHAGFGMHFAKSGQLDPKFHRWLLDAYELRREGDYGTETTVSRERLTELIARAREFLEAIRQYLGRQP